MKWSLDTVAMGDCVLLCFHIKSINPAVKVVLKCFILDPYFSVQFNNSMVFSSFLPIVLFSTYLIANDRSLHKC